MTWSAGHAPIVFLFVLLSLLASACPCERINLETRWTCGRNNDGRTTLSCLYLNTTCCWETLSSDSPSWSRHTILGALSSISKAVQQAGHSEVRLVFVGDSLIRNHFAAYYQGLQSASDSSTWLPALFESLRGSPQRSDVFHFPPNCESSKSPSCIKFDLHYAWRPFLKNITSELVRISDLSIFPPSPLSVLYLGFGSWELLHHSPEIYGDYKEDLEDIKELLLKIKEDSSWRVIFQTLGMVESSKFASLAKQQYLTNEFISYFNQLSDRVFFPKVGPSFGFKKVDLASLMESAIEDLDQTDLTIDGIHLTPALTDALFQVSSQTIKTAIQNQNDDLVLVKRDLFLAPSIERKVRDVEAKGENESGQKTEREEAKEQQAVTPPAAIQFVGRDPVLGLFVGLYIFLALLIGDPFLFLKFSTRLLE